MNPFPPIPSLRPMDSRVEAAHIVMSVSFGNLPQPQPLLTVASSWEDDAIVCPKDTVKEDCADEDAGDMLGEGGLTQEERSRVFLPQETVPALTSDTTAASPESPPLAEMDDQAFPFPRTETICPKLTPRQLPGPGYSVRAPTLVKRRLSGAKIIKQTRQLGR